MCQCEYCGYYCSFNIDDDGREYCTICGHYTGFREECDEYGYYWVDETDNQVERDCEGDEY